MRTRNFKGSDAYLFETANVIGNLLNADLATFTSFDRKMDAGFITAYQAKIDAAMHFSSDGLITDQQSQKTVNVLHLLRQAREKYQDVKYFAKKAFPYNVEIRNELGFNDIDKARRVQSEMITFLNELSTTCLKYENKLSEAGMPAALIPSIDQISKDLLIANTSQETFIKSRPVITAERVAKLNEIYDMLLQINEAAQIVYRDNDAKQRMFIYMASTSSEEESQVFVKEIPPHTTTEVFNAAYDGARVFSFTNGGSETISVFLSNDGINPTGNQIPINADQTVTVTSGQLGNSGNKLMCTNSGNLMGSLEVELG